MPQNRNLKLFYFSLKMDASKIRKFAEEYTLKHPEVTSDNAPKVKILAAFNEEFTPKPKKGMTATTSKAIDEGMKDALNRPSQMDKEVSEPASASMPMSSFMKAPVATLPDTPANLPTSTSPPVNSPPRSSPATVVYSAFNNATAPLVNNTAIYKEEKPAAFLGIPVLDELVTPPVNSFVAPALKTKSTIKESPQGKPKSLSYVRFVISNMNVESADNLEFTPFIREPDRFEKESIEYSSLEILNEAFTESACNKIRNYDAALTELTQKYPASGPKNPRQIFKLDQKNQIIKYYKNDKLDTLPADEPLGLIVKDFHTCDFKDSFLLNKNNILSTNVIFTPNIIHSSNLKSLGVDQQYVVPKASYCWNSDDICTDEAVEKYIATIQKKISNDFYVFKTHLVKPNMNKLSTLFKVVFKSRTSFLYNVERAQRVALWKRASSSVSVIDDNETAQMWAKILTSSHCFNVIMDGLDGTTAFEDAIVKLVEQPDSTKLFMTALYPISFIFTPFQARLPMEILTDKKPVDYKRGVCDNLTKFAIDPNTKAEDWVYYVNNEAENTTLGLFGGLIGAN
jgi:hypothetical protein